MIDEPIGAAPIGASAAAGAPPPVLSADALDALTSSETYTLTTPIANSYPEDTVSASDLTVAGDVYYALADALGLSDSALVTVYPTLRDAALLVDAATATVLRGATLADAIALADLLRAAYDALLEEAITVDTVDSTTAYKLALLAERVLATGLATSYQQAYAAAVSAVAVSVLSGSHYFEGALADTVGATEDLLAVLVLLAGMSDEATFEDTAVPTVRMTAVFADSTTLADAIAAQATMGQLLEDAVGVTVALSYGGAEYVGFVLNTTNKAASSYTNFPFNSMARLDGRYFAMADDGLYELAGDTDDGTPITATLRTGLMNFGSQAFKRLPAVYFGAKTDGTFLFSVIVTSTTGTKQQYQYTMAEKTAAAVREHRLEPGKGLKSVYWQFELETVDGADLMLDTLAMAPMVLNYRV